jgi:hypothetical protein
MPFGRLLVEETEKWGSVVKFAGPDCSEGARCPCLP